MIGALILGTTFGYIAAGLALLFGASLGTAALLLCGGGMAVTLIVAGIARLPRRQPPVSAPDRHLAPQH